MIKSVIKNCLAGTIYYSGGLSLRRTLKQGDSQAVILMYHRVLPTNPTSSPDKLWERYRSLPGIVVSPEMFDKQMRFLARRYTVISLSCLLDWLEGKGKLPSRAVVITFDDGWRDNFDYAFPVLKHYAIPATIFLTTGYVDSSQIFWPERVIGYLAGAGAENAAKVEEQLADLVPKLSGLVKAIAVQSPSKRISLIDRLVNEMKELTPASRDQILAILGQSSLPSEGSESASRVMLNWKEIREMQQGGISFGSHCITHELLTTIELARCERELKESKQVIEAQLGCSVDAVAYPNGNFNGQIKELAKSAGYRCGLSVQRGRVDFNDDRFELNRVNIHQGCSSGIRGGFSAGLFSCSVEGFPK